MNIEALLKYGPLLVKDIKDGFDIYQRLAAGDQTAEEAAKDWLGVTEDVEAAIQNWEDSK